MNFTHLLTSIQQTHDALQQQAVKAINRSLTVRNWLIGYYIVEFEQKGEDRAKYGDGLLSEISKAVQVPGLSLTNLKLNRQFYLSYPQIGQTVSDFLRTTPLISQTSDQFEPSWVTPPISGEWSKSNQDNEDQPQNFSLQPNKILNNLSFSHITELLPITDPLKRAFYEIECIKGTWSVRELKRQINSLYFERSGLSRDPQKLSAMVVQSAETLRPSDIIKSVYTFEFLGLRPKDVIEESDLETALLDHLQQFMLELGHGFCFEARQQKILIGDEYFFIDLVFYHRILKCHLLIDLKVEAFTHNNAGQLNTYLNYYKKEVMQESDNMPIGILMVTDKNKALVEYATAGMDNALFVSKYLVQLPSKEELQQFVQNELKNL
ncbi:MAG TPA: PDDEXK nuclease domain-containing protein [Flavisolibacter sp.]